jgi:hypothetical protein
MNVSYQSRRRIVCKIELLSVAVPFPDCHRDNDTIRGILPADSELAGHAGEVDKVIAARQTASKKLPKLLA